MSLRAEMDQIHNFAALLYIVQQIYSISLLASAGLKLVVTDLITPLISRSVTLQHDD